MTYLNINSSQNISTIRDHQKLIHAICLHRKCLHSVYFNIFNFTVWLICHSSLFKALLKSNFCLFYSQVYTHVSVMCFCITFYVRGFEIPIPYSRVYFLFTLVNSLMMTVLVKTCSWFNDEWNCCVQTGYIVLLVYYSLEKIHLATQYF